ncbi:MAG: DUF3048 domain-containing protein [Bacillota bacterium]
MVMARQYLGFLLALAVGIVGLSSCGQNRNKPVEVPEEPPDENEVSAPEPVPFRCPLDGTAVDEEVLGLRAVAVSVDNHPEARPQAGLSEACLVYELPVEGGLTRYLAVYLHGLPETVGPVRSARPYFLDYASGHEAVLVHAGASPAASQEMEKMRFPSLNDMKGDRVFWRSPDRNMPHNLYSGMTKIRDVLVSMGMEGVTTSSHPFEVGKAPRGAPSESLSIQYPGDGPKVEFTYDSAGLHYRRSVNGQPDTDLAGGDPLLARNVVVQFVKAWIIPGDPEGRMDVESWGEGKLLAFSEGCVREGTWKRQDRLAPLVFLDEAGESLVLVPGQTWVEVVHDKVVVKYQ